MSVEILWVHDDFNGPMNGLCMYEGKKCWFSRTSEVIVTSSDSTENSDYNIYKLEEDFIQRLEDEHREYCRISGAPLAHGDPRIIKRHTCVEKSLPPTAVESGGFDVEKRSLLNVEKYEYKINPMNVSGEKIGEIKQKCFSNYYLPRRVERQ